MKTAEKNVGRKGLGFGSVLFLIFLVLKLTGHIDWSWWWVAAPLWLPFAIIALFIVVVAFMVHAN